MDDVERKRIAIRKAYSGFFWSERVNKMSDGQVVAVYLRLKSQNKI